MPINSSRNIHLNKYLTVYSQQQQKKTELTYYSMLVRILLMNQLIDFVDDLQEVFYRNHYNRQGIELQ